MLLLVCMYVYAFLYIFKVIDSLWLASGVFPKNQNDPGDYKLCPPFALVHAASVFVCKTRVPICLNVSPANTNLLEELGPWAWGNRPKVPGEAVA